MRRQKKNISFERMKIKGLNVQERKEMYISKTEITEYCKKVAERKRKSH